MKLKFNNNYDLFTIRNQTIIYNYLELNLSFFSFVHHFEHLNILFYIYFTSYLATKSFYLLIVDKPQ